MKQNEKQIGLQLLNNTYGLNVKENPTLGFLSIVCCCMKKEDVQDFTGLTEWEYNRIFYEHPEDCLKRWHRSPKMAFKTLEAHLAKQNLDPCQETFSIHLWNWIRDEYLCELADEVEQLIEENIFQDISEKDGFVICEDELNEVGLLMLMHIMEQQDSGMKAFE